MWRDLIEAPEQITVNGFTWWIQQFNKVTGEVDAVNLYDEDGNFICEFESVEELTEFVEGVV